MLLIAHLIIGRDALDPRSKPPAQVRFAHYEVSRTQLERAALEDEAKGLRERVAALQAESARNRGVLDRAASAQRELESLKEDYKEATGDCGINSATKRAIMMQVLPPDLAVAVRNTVMAAQKTMASVTPEYLEAVTRDTAQLALNRSPETLQYWLDGIVAIAAPESRGALKAKLMEIMAEQEGSQVTQFVTIDWIRTNPDELTSQVGGVLHTIVGSRDVRREHKVFEFHWKYTGVSLRLKGFGVVVKEGEEE